MSYDDDRPGMMRVHIAEKRAVALSNFYTRNDLRSIARRKGVPAGYSVKADLAYALALHGVIAPDYDRAAEA